MDTRKEDERLQLVASPHFIEAVDEWRRGQADHPSRSEAIQRLAASGERLDRHKDRLRSLLDALTHRPGDAPATLRDTAAQELSAFRAKIVELEDLLARILGANLTMRTAKPSPAVPRSVGPEDEARGGHEAPSDHAGPTVPGTERKT